MKLLKVLILVYLIALFSPVMAHSKLISSEPAHDAGLTAAPTQLMLEFNRDVRLFKLELLDKNEEEIELDFKPSREKQTTFQMDLPELEIGVYQVKWIAMSADSHKMKGEFSFTLLADDDATDNN